MLLFNRLTLRKMDQILCCSWLWLMIKIEIYPRRIYAAIWTYKFKGKEYKNNINNYATFSFYT
jgi:hypothetical protein